MRTLEMIMACLCALSIFDLFKAYVNYRIKRWMAPPVQVNPGRGDAALKEFIDHMRKMNVPFEIIKGPPGTVGCQCPQCVANREIEKAEGGDRVLH